MNPAPQHCLAQFAWRPTGNRGAEPPQCAVVTSSGALLVGPLGGALDAIREDVSAAAWSDDGALLAYARHESITVLDLAASASFITRLMTGVGACTNSREPSARPRGWRQLHCTAMFVVVCGVAITRTLPCMPVSDAQRPGWCGGTVSQRVRQAG